MHNAMFTAHSHSPKPRRLSKRGGMVSAILLICCMVAFLAVARTYRSEGGMTVEGAMQPKGSQFLVDAQVAKVDPELGVANVRFQFWAGSKVAGLTDSEGRFVTRVVINVSGLDGEHVFIYKPGSLPSTQSVALGMDGQLSAYPLDKYSVPFLITAQVVDLADPVLGAMRTIPVVVAAAGPTASWNTRYGINANLKYNNNVIFLERVFSTKVFAFFTITLMALLSITAILVATLAVSHRRRAEVGMMGWLTGLLFALPALRKSLPFAPPIGVTMDVLVFLWTLVFGLLAALMVTFSWWIQSRESLLLPEPPPKEAIACERKPRAEVHSHQPVMARRLRIGKP